MLAEPDCQIARPDLVRRKPRPVPALGCSSCPAYLLLQCLFQLKAMSAVQNYTINITKVEHNIRIDEALFSKPATP